MVLCEERKYTSLAAFNKTRPETRRIIAIFFDREYDDKPNA